MGLLDFWQSSASPPASREASPPAPPASSANTPNKFITELNPTGIKPCCACPDTKMKRDDCFLLNGPGSDNCEDLVAAHRKCMASLGFTI